MVSRNQKKILTFLILFFGFLSYGASDLSMEELEINLAKAELAFSKKKITEAFKIIRKNINPKNFHLDSYKFLSEVYFAQNKIKKGLKVLYFVVRKLHTNRYLKTSTIQELNKLLGQVKAPSNLTMSFYFRLGQIYFKIYDEGKFNEKFKKKLLTNAKKYFLICDYYKYQTPQTKYYLSYIYNKGEEYQKAIDTLVITKDLFKNKNSKEEKNIKNNINFLLADSLIKEGYTDAGSLYLKSLYHSSKKSDLKRYATVYLDSISETFASVTINYGLQYDTNVNDLNSEERDDFDADTFFSKSGVAQDRSINFFYSSPNFGDFSYDFSFDAQEAVHNKEQLSQNDSRILGASMEFKYDQFTNVLIKLGYSFSKSFIKEQNGRTFKSSTNTHEVFGRYIYTLKKGTLTNSVPLTFNNNKDGTSTRDFGFSTNYTPFWQSLLFSPSFSGEFTRVGSIEGEDPSYQWELGVSNHLAISPLASFFTFVNYTWNINADDANAFHQLTIQGLLSLAIKPVQNLSFNIGLRRDLKSTGAGEKINKWLISGALSYTY